MFPTPFDEDERGLTRRRFLEGSALVPIVLVVGGCGADDESRRGTAASNGAAASAPASTRVSSEAAAEAGILQATPPCDDGDDEPTEAQTEGPYYTPDTPRRSNLVTAGVRGTALLVTGDVVDTQCRPVRGALLDFWQADAAGRYDNEGYRLRGHQFADGRGRFALRTIVPGLYPGAPATSTSRCSARTGRSSRRSSTSPASRATAPTASSTARCSWTSAPPAPAAGRASASSWAEEGVSSRA